MDRWKAEVEQKNREKRRAEERRSEKTKSQKKEDVGARKGRKVAKHCGFPTICGSIGSWDHFWKLRCGKSARHCGAKHISKSKCTKHLSSGALLGVEMSKKCTHAVVARSTFASEKAKNTSRSDHFWKLRCGKSARRCGAKQISKSKCTKHFSCGALLGVEMSKKCTPLWRKAHLQVKRLKTLHVWTTFGSWDAEKVHAVVARSTFPSQNVQSTPGSDHFWKLRCRKSARLCGAQHLSKSKR